MTQSADGVILFFLETSLHKAGMGHSLKTAFKEVVSSNRKGFPSRSGKTSTVSQSMLSQASLWLGRVMEISATLFLMASRVIHLFLLYMETFGFKISVFTVIMVAAE